MKLSFSGDKCSDLPPNYIIWSNDSFQHTEVVKCDHRCEAKLAKNPILEWLGPFPNDHAGIMTLTTRVLMSLPHKYAPLIFGRYLFPWNVWTHALLAVWVTIVCKLRKAASYLEVITIQSLEGFDRLSER